MSLRNTQDVLTVLEEEKAARNTQDVLTVMYDHGALRNTQDVLTLLYLVGVAAPVSGAQLITCM